MKDRRWRLAGLLSAVYLCGLFSVLTPAAQPGLPLPSEFVPGEVLVQFRPGVAESRRVARRPARARLLRRFAALDIEHLRLPAGADARATVQALRANPDVREAQLNYIRHIAAPAPPNDQLWLSGALWGMERISTQPAWTGFGAGSTTVVLANIDTGVNYNHPDLAANMWRNPGEIPGNGRDDDANGYIDDVHGIDLVNLDQDPMDDHGHGTHTAGIAGAVANNGQGVVGVAWNVRILACKFLSAAGFGTDSAAIACFDYVVDQKSRGVNVRVTSNSWGHERGSQPATLLKNAIDAAGAAGILNVFASGNSNTDNDVQPHDPSSFTSPSIVAVAGSNQSDMRTGNYGRTSVDLAAPGVNISSTHGNDYAALTGTSQAAPHVAGAAALLFAHHPTLTVSEVKDALLTNVDQVPALSAVVASGGRLNVYRSMAALNVNGSPTASLTSPADGATFQAPATIPLAASAHDADGSVTSVDFYANSNLIARDTSAPYALTWSGVASGTYRLTAVATDNAGATGESSGVTVTVNAASASPFPGAAAPVPGTIEAENFDNGGEGVAYHDNSPGNSGGEYRATDVDIAAASDTDGGLTVGWVGAGEWLSYSVNVAAAGVYTIDVRVASAGPGGMFHVEIAGADVTGPLAVPNTGDWQTWATVSRPGITLNSGPQVWRVVMDSNGATGAVGNFNYLRVSASAAGGPTPFPAGPVLVPGIVEAENFDNGGEGIAYHDNSPGNSGGEYRGTDVDIAPAFDTGGGYTLGWVSAGEWLAYSVNVGAAGVYAIELRVASAGPGGTFHIEVGGADVTGSIAVPNTGDWQTWTTVSSPGITLNGGPQLWRVVMDSNGVTGAVGNFNYLRVVDL